MDLVKLSAAGGMAAFAVLALVATSDASSAEPTSFGAPTELPAPDIQTRIDAAFDASKQESVFVLPGPAPQLDPGAALTLPERTTTTQWPLSVGATASWAPLVDEAARRFGIPPEWVHGVMQAESGGRTTMNGRPITSHAGAMGLMQVMPGTFAELTARYGLGSDPHDPRANIHAGAAYLREMYDRYGAAYFLAAYNAGPARVGQHLRTGRPLPLETLRYNAILLPRLFPGTAVPASSASVTVQDLTGFSTIGASASSTSRPRHRRRADPPRAPVFVTANDASAAPPAQPNARPSDGLFVTLMRSDRRQVVATAAPLED